MNNLYSQATKYHFYFAKVKLMLINFGSLAQVFETFMLILTEKYTQKHTFIDMETDREREPVCGLTSRRMVFSASSVPIMCAFVALSELRVCF